MDEATSDTIADGVERQLDPRWVPLQRVRGAITATVLAMVTFAFTMTMWVGSGVLLAGLMLLPGWALLVGLLTWHLLRWPAVSYRFSSYRIDADGLEIRDGVYWRTLTNVPRSRVQHTDVSQGPFERRYGLGTLIVYTAGTQHSQVKLPGLDFEVARRIRTHLLPREDSDAV
jgi:membrane protein YdbS with pleckstrin-like domain